MNDLSKRMTAREIANLPLRDFTQYVDEFLKPKKSEKINKIAIKFPYALNCKFDEKLADRHRVYKYTVFINNAGTIAHVLTSDSDELIVRLKLSPSVKHLSIKRQKYIIWNKIKHIFDISPVYA